MIIETMYIIKKLLASMIILIIIMINSEGVNGDIMTNCKTKIRNMWLKYCATEDILREKRDVSPRLLIPVPVNTGLLMDNLNRKSRGQEIAPLSPLQDEKELREIIREPRYSGYSLSSPISGDDLVMGLTMSYIEMEELCEEMIERFPRGAKNKDQIMKMITAYATSCCNENLNDANCIDPANVINCPS